MKLTKLELFPWISRKFRKSRKSWKWDLLKIEITEILDILEMGRCNERDPSMGVWGGREPPKVSTPFLLIVKKKK